MKNLSKLVALVLLLAPAALRADIWCHGENEHIWTYASGQTIYTFRPDHPVEYSLSSSQAYFFADPLCLQSWNNFASHQSNVQDGSGYRVSLYSVAAYEEGYERWNYRCQACILGYPPYIHVAHPVRLRPVHAGDVANELVAGQIVSIALHDASGDRPYYLVDVLTTADQIQVVVDANTGRAEVVNPEETGACRE